MKKPTFPQKWLNLILHLSSLIYKQKTALLYSGILKTVFTGIFIVVLEILLALLSFPFYFFIAPAEEEKKFNGKVKAYRLRRKVTLAALILFLLFELLKTFTALTGIALFPTDGDAKISEWDFREASNYEFDSPYIKFEDEMVIFDPTSPAVLPPEELLPVLENSAENETLLKGDLLTEKQVQSSEQAKVKLAEVSLEGKTLGEEITTQEALVALVSLTTTEKDIQKAVLKTVLTDNSESIAQELLSDEKMSARIKEDSDKGLFQSLENKVQEVLVDSQFQNEMVATLEVNRQVEKVLNPISTSEIKNEIVDKMVEQYLQEKDTLSVSEVMIDVLDETQKNDLKEIVSEEMAKDITAQNIVLDNVMKSQEEFDGVSSNSLLQVTVKGPSGQRTLSLDQFHFEAGSVVMQLDLPRDFIPGVYEAEIQITNPLTQETQVLKQDFLWGVLAVNTNKDVYKRGEEGLIDIGVLDDKGRPVCEATVSLTLRKPDGTEANPPVENTGQCEVMEPTNIKPDYQSKFNFVQEGEYQLTVMATLSDGKTRATTSRVRVEDRPDYRIERQAATRLYPVGEAPMTINIQFNEAFRGTLSDVVPKSFEVSKIEPKALIKENGEEKLITWELEAKAGEIKTLSYLYDAPDISPEFYTLGPISGSQDLLENRVWQIANDEPVIEADSSSNLRLNWQFNQGTGSSATDSSANALTGTLTNMEAVDWTTATPTTSNQNPFALDFDGSSEYVTRADDALLDFIDTDDFTLTGWFNRDTSNTTDTIIAKRNSTANNQTGYLLYIPSNTDRLILDVSDGVDRYTLTSATSFTSTGWNHFAVVWDQDNATNTEIYINGVDNNATDSGTIGNIGTMANALAFRAGAESDAGNPFDGKLDDIRVYNKVLSQSEITTLASGNSPGGGSTGLQLWLKAGSGVTTSGAAVTTWASQSAGSSFTQGTAGNRPNLTSNAVNFNPAITFDGVNDRLTSTFVANPLSVFSVIRNTDTGSTDRVFFGSSSSVTSYAAAQKANDVSGNAVASYFVGGVNESVSTPSLDNQFYLHEGHLTATSNGTASLLINAGQIGTNAGTGALSSINATAVGSGYTSGVLGSPFQGDVAEILVYNVTKTGTDRQKIESYLALKYGITLDQAAAGGGTSYLNSAGTTIWAADPSDVFEHDIAGIGRDDSSALNQTQSKSVNTDAILKVSQATSQNNLDTLLWSNDNGAATWTATDAPSGYRLLTRTWEAKETNDIGTVDLEFDVADTDFDVPALLLGTSFYFVYDSDDDGLFTDETPTLMKDDGTIGDDTSADAKWTKQLDFSAGDTTTRFTIATQANLPPTVTDPNISIAGGSGTGGAYIVGNTITVTWNNAAGGDNNSGITTVTSDLSGWGGSSTAAMTDTTACGGTSGNNIYEACFTLVSGAIDATNVNASVSATNADGSTTTSDTSNATVDNQPPTVSSGAISVTGATGTGGAFKSGDTATGRWNNTLASGDANADTLTTVSFNLANFKSTNTSISGANASNIWTGSITGALDAQGDTNNNVTVTVTDNAGNQTSVTGTNNYTVDTQLPLITGITSVAGDTTAPYYDNTDNGSTAILFTSTDLGTGVSACKWNSSTTTYALMANTCTSTSNCTTNLTGEGNKTVYLSCIDGAGNALLTNTQVDYVLDGTGPTGTSIAASTARIINNDFPTFTVSDGTDFSGTNTATRLLQRAEAPYSANTCGTFTGFTTVTPTGTYPNFSDNTATGSKCYQYRWSVSDNAGNASTVTTPTLIRVPLTTLVITAGDNLSYGTTGNPIGYTFPTALQVLVTDGGTNTALAGEVTVDFAFTSVPGTPTAVGQSLSTSSSITDATGHTQTTLTLGDRAGTYQVQATSTGAAISNTVNFTATAENYVYIAVDDAAIALDLDPAGVSSASVPTGLNIITNAASYSVYLIPDRWPAYDFQVVNNWLGSLGFGWSVNGGGIQAFLENILDPDSTLVYQCTGTTCQELKSIDLSLHFGVDFTQVAGIYTNNVEYLVGDLVY